MPGRGLTLAWKIVAANTLLAVFAVVLVVTMQFRKDRTLLEATIRRELGQTVAAGALLLQGVPAVALGQDPDTAQASQVGQKLSQLEHANPAVRRLYILGRGPQEQPRLLRGPAGLDESRFAPAAQRKLAEALAREVPVQTPVYEDADGQQWISAFHPIRDDQGQVVALLGADFRASELKLEARHKLRSTLISASGAVLLAIFLSLFLARSITKPLKLVAESTSEIASGNLNICLNLTSQDEIGELADSFNRMVERLAAAAEESDRHADFRLDPLAELFGKYRSSDNKIVDAIFEEVGRMSHDGPPEDDMTVLFLAWKLQPQGPV